VINIFFLIQIFAGFLASVMIRTEAYSPEVSNSAKLKYIRNGRHHPRIQGKESLFCFVLYSE